MLHGPRAGAAHLERRIVEAIGRVVKRLRLIELGRVPKVELGLLSEHVVEGRGLVGSRW